MGLESLLTRAEEEDIHERAELHSLTICPDVDYYVLPEDDPEPFIEDPKSQVQQHRRRKRRNYLNCKCYVTEHGKDDLYDNTKMLSIGTKLLRPTSKLVELVAQAIEGSPDGLLQVQQIYTVLQNRFPYFRYMDKSAISSWRSSIRHALYQKWFVKIRFKTDTINCKGCYWKISHHYQQMEKTEVKKPKKDSNDEVGNPQDYDLDPNTHDTVLALLTQEEEEEGKTQTPQSNLQEVMRIAKEYGISISDCISEADYKIGKIAMQTQGRDADPILSNCISDQKHGSDEEFVCTPSKSNSSSSSSSERQLSFINSNNSPFMSPLINEATKKELIGIDPKTQIDKSPFGNWIQDWEDHYFEDSPFFVNTMSALDGDDVAICSKAEDCTSSSGTYVPASSSDCDCTNDTIVSSSPDIFS